MTPDNAIICGEVKPGQWFKPKGSIALCYEGHGKEGHIRITGDAQTPEEAIEVLQTQFKRFRFL